MEHSHDFKFREYRRTSTVWACKMDAAFTVTTEHNAITGQPGDYLVITAAGEMVPVGKESFEKSHLPVECPRDFCEATDCECAKTLNQIVRGVRGQLS